MTAKPPPPVPPSSDEQTPKLAPQIPRLNSELAAQAALRAQQLLRKQSSQEQMQMPGKSLPPPLPPQSRPVPAIPARGSSDRSAPPEIPPKRHSLKSLPDGMVPGLPGLPPPLRQPPPLPKKPVSAHSSAQNSPLAGLKFREKPPPPPEKHSTLSAEAMAARRCSNPFEMPPPPPPLVLQSAVAALSEQSSKNAVPVPSPAPTRASEAKKLNQKPAAAAAATSISPTDEFGSEDALRGIESGLRNMERAMQEQMNLRCLEAAVQNNFDLSFKASLAAGGAAGRHLGSSVNLRTTNYERNLSLDESRAGDSRQSLEELKQLRAQAQQQSLHNSSSSSVSSTSASQVEQSMRSTIEHHMRSLDRNLPLELQYSRHRMQNNLSAASGQHHQVATQGGVAASGQSQQQQQQQQSPQPPMPLSSEFREQIRQQLLGNIPPQVVHNMGQLPGSAAAAALLQHQAQSRAAAAAAAAAAAQVAASGGVGVAAGGLSREELRMRRRSSHDETQMSQTANGGMQVTRLREHWDETSQCVLQRAAQLKNMLSDSQRFEAKRVELEKWLARMEQRAERMGTVATTADILEAQQKEQKSFHAELHQNKQHFELFSDLTQNLIAVYPNDDTSRIKKVTEAINQRYSNLTNGVVSRGKQLHAAVHNLQSFDRAMDQFLAFLSETETLCENAESDIERNPLMFKIWDLRDPRAGLKWQTNVDGDPLEFAILC
ncbi:hypothetical protein ACLKA6_005185 [Drosophila palustris]